MSNMTRKTAYFDDCTSVVKCYLDYLMSDSLESDLIESSPQLTKDDAQVYLTVINNNYKVCSDVLRRSVSVALGLESSLNYFQWKDLALVCSKKLEGRLLFAGNMTRAKKQGILQMCVHIFYVLKDIAVSEVKG